MNSQTIAAWLGLAALAIGAVVRLLKTDALAATLARFGLPPVPKRALPWLAVAFGIGGGFVAALQRGLAWSEALVEALGGALAGAVAIAGHELVVEGARGGRELGAADVSAGPAGGGALGALVLVGALASGCTPWQRGAVRTVLNELEKECAWRAPSTDVKWIATMCRIADPLVPMLEQLVESKAAAMRAGVYAAPAPAATQGGR